jgi:hypothetical protein
MCQPTPPTGNVAPVYPASRFAHRELQPSWERRFDALYSLIFCEGRSRDDAIAMQTGLFPCSNSLFWTHHPTLRREMRLSKAQLNKRLAQMSTVVPHPSDDVQGQLFVAINFAQAVSSPPMGIRDWVLRKRNIELALPQQEMAHSDVALFELETDEMFWIV